MWEVLLYQHLLLCKRTFSFYLPPVFCDNHGRGGGSGQAGGKLTS